MSRSETTGWVGQRSTTEIMYSRVEADMSKNSSGAAAQKEEKDASPDLHSRDGLDGVPG